MEPAVGLILIFVLACLNATIAYKRGRSGLGFFMLSIVPVLPLVMLTSLGTHGDGVAMGWAAFFAPVATFIATIVVRSGKELAVVNGAHGNYVACPFCAEPVRGKAIRCRHCGSDIGDAAA